VDHWQMFIERDILIEDALEQIMSVSDRLTDHVELFNFNAAAREMIMPDGMAAHFQVLVQRKV